MRFSLVTVDLRHLWQVMQRYSDSVVSPNLFGGTKKIGGAKMFDFRRTAIYILGIPPVKAKNDYFI